MAKSLKQPPDQLTQSVVTSIRILADPLGDSTAALSEALGAIERGEQKAALGIVLGLEATLIDALTLQHAILVMHRQR